MPLDFSKLRAAGNDSLQQTQNATKVILLHTGVVLLISLLLSMADFLLNRQINTIEGLHGMNLRAALLTLQTVLRLTQLLLLPLWQIGYTYFTLRVARREAAGFSDLLEGFRRFLPVLRLKMLMAFLAVGLVFIGSYMGSFLFMITPWSTPLVEQLEAIAASGMDEAALTEAILSLSTDVMLPLTVISLLCFAVLAVFVFFRLRMAELWLMDHPDGSALMALRSSRAMLRGNCLKLLKVDLGFWWFYLLEVLVTVICYGDRILSVMGIEMTTDAFGSYFLFFSLYLFLQLALYWWKRNEVSVTYAHAYLELVPQETPVEES